MPGPQPQAIELSDRQRAMLEQSRRGQTNPQRLVRRASLILIMAADVNNQQAARQARHDRATARVWRTRWLTASPRLAAAEARGCSDKEFSALALTSLALVTQFTDEAHRAVHAAEESVALFRELGDQWGHTSALGVLAVAVMRAQHDYAAARAYQEESLRLQREVGDSWGLAPALWGLAIIALQQGDYGFARARIEESLVLFRELGDKAFTHSARNELANIARYPGDDAQAEALYQEAIMGWRELGNRGGIARCLECLAFIAGKRAQAQRAATLLGAAQAIREASGATMLGEERAEYDAALESIRAQLDEARFNAAWAAGRTMRMEQAIACALSNQGYRPIIDGS